MKFRKKPIVIEAVQWTGNNFDDMYNFIGDKATYHYYEDRDYFTIDTLEGEHRASKGDWIIRGIKGEFYPCKPDIFEKTYEKVE